MSSAHCCFSLHILLIFNGFNRSQSSQWSQSSSSSSCDPSLSPSSWREIARSVALLWLCDSWLRDFVTSIVHHSPIPAEVFGQKGRPPDGDMPWAAWNATVSDGFWWLLMASDDGIDSGRTSLREACNSFAALSLGFSSALIPLSWKLQLCKCVHAAVFKQLGNMERMLFLRLASVCHVVLISDSSATLWLDLAIGIVTEPPPKLILRPLSWCQSSPRRHFDYGRWQLIEELSNWRATMNRLGNCSINIDIDLNSVQPPLLEVQGQKPQLALRKRMNKATSWYIWKQNLNGFPISFSSSHSSMVASMASMASMASSSPSTLSCNTSGRFTSNAGSGWGRATQWQPSTSFTFRQQNGVKTEQNIGQCSIYSLGGMTQTLLGYMCDMSHATLW